MSSLWNLTIESLSWIELQRLNEEAAIKKTVKQLRIDDKKLVDEARGLVYETVRRLNTIDFILDESLEPLSLGDLKLGMRSFLRLYTYLVHYSAGSFEKANELVEHALNLFPTREFRQVKNIPDIVPLIEVPFDEITDTQRLAYKYFHPSWYVDYLYNTFGEELTENLIKHVDYPKYLRLNTLKASSISLDRLFEEGYQLLSEPELSNTYRLLDDETVTKTQEYRGGSIIMQDKASILMGEIANPRPGDTVLDVCAAPGVKTSHLAQQMENNGRIVSVDFDKRRLRSWERLMNRLGVENAEPVLADASKPGSIPMIEADLVVVDPPCTGTGLFHRNPSGKWRLTSHSIDNMSRLQTRILLNSAKYLRDGGALVYSTCSVTVEENEGVIQSLLEKYPEFRLVESTPRLGDPGLREMSLAQRLYPYKHACNGFFIAKLVKDI